MSRNISGSNHGNAIGDTVAVGNNNTQHVTINHHSRNGGGNRNGGTPGKEVNPFAIGAIALLLIIGISHQFARHADFAFLLLLSLALVIAFIPAASLFLHGISAFDSRQRNRAIGSILVGSIVAISAMYEMQSYPNELTTIAMRASGPKEFWCSLNGHGQGIAAQGALGAAGLALAALLAFPFVFDIIAQQTTNNRLRVFTAWLSPNRLMILAVAFALLSGTFIYFGEAVVQHQAETTSNLICPTR